ncbi:MAG: DUF72 domain-containing protein [Balneolaceae bacterium]
MITRYSLGTTQWGVKEWAGHFYTKDAKPDSFLQQYASVFNTVEGNTTFYRVPAPETVKKWGESVPDGFKFCFKFPQSITHFNRLNNVGEEVAEFLDLFETIRKNLGPFHLQLSSQFSFKEFEKLEKLLDILPPHYSYAVEVRHPDYYDKGRNERRLNEMLKSYHVDRVIFDTRRLHNLQSGEKSVLEAQDKKPKLPVRFNSTGSKPFIRYVGGNDILNNSTYLKEWTIIVADWIRDGKHPYVFIHAPSPFYAPELARYFHNELKKLIEVNPMPAWPIEQQDKQLGLF